VFGKAYNFVKQPSFQHGFKRGVAAGADLLGAGAAASKFVAPELFAPLTAAAGVAQVASGYMGRGMYAPKKSANSLMMGGMDTSPNMRTVADETGSLIITHRERVADIIAPSSTGFTVQSFDVNPGLEGFAPWLHQLASCYEEYQIMQCVYEYHGHQLIGIQNSLDLQGQVIAATQYNVKLPPFTDRHEMTAYPFANQCSLNGTLVHGVEADPSKIQGDGHKLVRVGGLLKDDDIRDHDHARFSLAMNNTPSDLFGKEIGQLYVYYTVKLIKPKISAGRGQSISVYKQYCKNANSSFEPFGNLTATDDSAVLVASKNTLGMVYKGSTPGSTPGNDDISEWEFPKHAVGVFKVVMTMSGASLDTGGADFLGNNEVGVIGNVAVQFMNYPGSGGLTTTKYQFVEDSTGLSQLEFHLSVRPNSSRNAFSVRTTFGADTIGQSAITITEINTLGNEIGVPEVKRSVDGQVVSL